MNYYFIIIAFILFIFYYLTKINPSKLIIKQREKLTIYECGFQEFDDVRKKFYIKFYLVAIVFLIFDLETILVYPIAFYLIDLNNHYFIYMIYIIYIISIGLAYEIYKNILS